MEIYFKLSKEFANTIIKADKSHISAIIYNARKIYLYIDDFREYDGELTNYFLSKLNESLNSLKAIEFEIDNYHKKEKFYKVKHQIENKIKFLENI